MIVTDTVGDRERNAHTASVPLGFQLYQDGAAVYVLYKMDEEIAQQHGLPKECVMKIEKNAPDMDAGVYLNLFNNQWGTNFPMWYEGDGRARFRLAKAKE